MRALRACVSVRRCRAPSPLPLPLTSPFRGFGAKVKIGSVHFGLFAVFSLLLRCFVAEAKAERVKDKSWCGGVRRAPLPLPSPCPLPCAVPCAVAVPSPCRRRANGTQAAAALPCLCRFKRCRLRRRRTSLATPLPLLVAGASVAARCRCRIRRLPLVSSIYLRGRWILRAMAKSPLPAPLLPLLPPPLPLLP